MKKVLWLIPLLLLGAGLLLAGCAKTGNKAEPSVEEDGGFKNNTNYDAPKVIKSTEIVSFSCDFSAIDLLDDESTLAGNAYELTADLKDGTVTGLYAFRTWDNNRSRQSFQAEPEFLDELQKLVKKHDLAQYNGRSYQVYGIPDEYGAGLSITYASGETIYAYDNQACFLTVAAMEDLERLFRQQAETEAAQTDFQ